MQTIKLADKEYRIHKLSSNAEHIIESLRALSELEKEKKACLDSLVASHGVLKNSIKQEVVAAKAGLVF
jgi:hypothetical protein